MRVLRNVITDAIAAGEDPVQLLGAITDLYFDGKMDDSVANTGQVSARIDEVLPVAEVLDQMWSGVAGALDAARLRIG
jgi:enoyl-[acyl-carrier protein] reductase II